MAAKTYNIVASTDDPRLILLAIEELEHRAHRLGLHVGARGLNRAKNAIGWEMAGNIEQAGRALLRDEL